MSEWYASSCSSSSRWNVTTTCTYLHYPSKRRYLWFVRTRQSLSCLYPEDREEAIVVNIDPLIRAKTRREGK